MNTYYKILVSSYSISTFSEGILLPIYAIFVQKVGGGALEAAGAVATYLILQGVIEIFIHKTDWSKSHRMFLMVGGWLLWLIGIASYLLVFSVPMLFLSQVLTGLGNALANPAFDAELAEHTDKGITEYEYSIFEGMQDIFQGIAALVGGLIVTQLGFSTLIYVMIFTASLSFFLILQYSRLVKPKRLHF